MKESMNLSSLKEGWGPFGPKQIAGLVIAFVLCLVLMIFGFGNQCIGFVLVGVILYMLPHMLGVESIKLLTVFGIVFFVVATICGGINSAGLVEADDGEPSDNDYFENVTYDWDSTTNTMSVSVDTKDYLGDEIVYMHYDHVSMIMFMAISGGSVDDVELTRTSGTQTYTGSIELKDDNLYRGHIWYEYTNSTGTTKNTTEATFITYSISDSDITMLSLKGCAYLMFEVILVFFILMYGSYFMRRRFIATREKMEKEGRLYPQGYGRCTSCGTVVLPGEVNCRKCGAYIDRPEEMKPDKKDFFECSDCGAEVPYDAKECPKCGAKFDEDDEIIVEHADHTVEVTNRIIFCPECGSEMPDSSAFCPKCGKEHKK